MSKEPTPSPSQTGTLKNPCEPVFSPRFGEHYASHYAPEEEKFVVFCEGNDLPGRFAHAQDFIICELGFGTGLSFLVTALLWLEKNPGAGSLDFVSIEKYPLRTSELESALSAYPSLASLSQALLLDYPGQYSGTHRLNLCGNRINLTLIFGEVSDALTSLELPENRRVDAWFLDGFSPARNPAMWQPAIFKRMRRLSGPDTTLATYTAAGQVRRDLTAAGFQMQKKPGHGKKRERMVGQVSDQPYRQPTSTPKKPWLHRPVPLAKSLPPTSPARLFEKDVSIIGGGIAGCALANRLAAKGFSVHLLEQADSLAAATSSNPAAIAHPSFSLDNDPASTLSQQGFLYTLATLKRLQREGLTTGFDPCGVILRPIDEEDRQRLEKIAQRLDHTVSPEFARWLTADELSHIANTEIGQPGWFIPSGGWVNLSVLCNALVDEFPPLITVSTGATVSRIERASSSQEHRWSLFTPGGSSIAISQSVVLAYGACAPVIQSSVSEVEQTLCDAAGLIIPNAGRIVSMSSHKHRLATVLCGGGYAVPRCRDELIIGASHEDPAAPKKEEQLLLKQFAKRQPDLAQKMEGSASSVWKGTRATAPDRLPMVGPIMPKDLFHSLYGKMIQGKAKPESKNPAFSKLEGLQLFTGLGSRGVVYSLLCAETLACELSGHPIPITRKLRNTLHPLRFYARQREQDPASTTGSAKQKSR